LVEKKKIFLVGFFHFLGILLKNAFEIFSVKRGPFVAILFISKPKYYGVIDVVI
jgi:hypothetical protein